MNCLHVRNRVLAVEDPNRIPEELGVHLDACSSCRTWMQKYGTLDGLLRRLPVRPDGMSAKLTLMEKIRSLPTPVPGEASERQSVPVAAPLIEPLTEASAPSPASPSAAGKWQPDSELRHQGARAWQYAARFWPAGLVAATVLLASVLWLGSRNRQHALVSSAPTDPLLGSLVSLNVELARTQTPAERVSVLARIADELHQEMRDIARADSTGENMLALEEMYRRVVLSGLYDQARLIERSQRKEVLGRIVEDLNQSAKSAEEKAESSPQHSALALHEAARTAREGTKRIRRLIEEASS